LRNDWKQAKRVGPEPGFIRNPPKEEGTRQVSGEAGQSPSVLAIVHRTEKTRQHP
jgi:hypothetical protein